MASAATLNAATRAAFFWRPVSTPGGQACSPCLPPAPTAEPCGQYRVSVVLEKWAAELVPAPRVLPELAPACLACCVHADLAGRRDLAGPPARAVADVRKRAAALRHTAEMARRVTRIVGGEACSQLSRWRDGEMSVAATPTERRCHSGFFRYRCGAEREKPRSKAPPPNWRSAIRRAYGGIHRRS